jgi:hypothetical protein
MADPVSWRVIKPGWKVEAADGSGIGEVDEIVGDDGADIFNGLAIATTTFGHPRYVPSERVAEIIEGTVKLSLRPDEVGQLDEYELPPTSLEVEPESGGGVVASIESTTRSLVGGVVQPVRPHSQRVGILDRLRFYVLRKRH